MGLRSAVSSLPDVRRGGIALSSVLLAAPILLVARPGASVLLLAASFVGAVALLEGRARTASRKREVASPVSGLSRPLARSGQCCARWELVERDGQRSLVMRWR